MTFRHALDGVFDLAIGQAGHCWPQRRFAEDGFGSGNRGRQALHGKCYTECTNSRFWERAMAGAEAVRQILVHLQRLNVGLRRAASAYDQSAEDAGRGSVLLTLHAVDDFLKVTLGIRDPSLFIPLAQLQYALHDLNRGKVVPLLAPKKVKNRPRDSTSREGFRALAAVAMELFIKGDVSRKQAARDVAAALSQMGYMNGPGKPITAKLVEDWRDRMTTERSTEYEPAGRFHRMRTKLLAMFPNDPSAAARYLLGRMPTTVPPDIPKKPPT
jgi:hypothetical protein